MRYRHEILTVLAIAVPVALLTCLAWKIFPFAVMDFTACLLLGLLLVEVLILCGLDINLLIRKIRRRERVRSRWIFLP